MSFARAALPWALAAAVAAACMALLANYLLPPRATPSGPPLSHAASPAPTLPLPASALATASRRASATVGARAPTAPGNAPEPTGPGSGEGTASSRLHVRDPQAMTRAWAMLDELRRKIADLEVGAGDASALAAAANVRRSEGAQLLEEAGMAEEPFASRLAAYRAAVADGGVRPEDRGGYFRPEDAERLRLIDALDALSRPATPARTDAGR